MTAGKQPGQIIRLFCLTWLSVARQAWQIGWRGLKWGCLGAMALSLIMVVLMLVFPLSWKLQMAHRIAIWCNAPWKSSLMGLTIRMAESFDDLPSSTWLETFSSIPPQLRLDVFETSAPDIQMHLLELMAESEIQRFPEKKKVVESLLEKTSRNYFVTTEEDQGETTDDENEGGFRQGQQRRQQKGDQWLASLTEEEQDVASAIHRQWFHPGLAMRHDHSVWVRADQLEAINAQFMRYDVFRSAYEANGGLPTLFITPFPGDMQAPDFARRYETDGLFIAPRRNSCNCRTDLDCMPPQHCRKRTGEEPGQMGMPLDHHTRCHFMGIPVSCQGDCAP